MEERPRFLEEKAAAFLDQLALHPAPDQFYPVISSPSVARVRMQSRSMSRPEEFLNFATSNYLGMGQRPEVRDAVVETMDRLGLGSNGSPVLSGYFDVHQELEKELAEFHGVEDAMLYPSGVSVNVGILSAFLEKGDAVVLDEYAHGCLYLGAKASGATLRSYPHADYDELDWLLGRLAKEKKTVLVGAVGIFSMTGEIEDLPAVDRLVRKHGAVLLLDDAHGLGVLGKNGAGTMEHFGLPESALTFHMGTLSKSLAGAGGYVCGKKSMLEYLRYHAATHMLSASISPPVAAGCLAALRILRRDGGKLSAELRRKADLFRAALRKGGADALGEMSGIIPVRVKNEEKIWGINREALGKKIFLNPVVYPGVPRGQGRLRFAVTINHTDEDLLATAETICALIRAHDGE